MGRITRLIENGRFHADLGIAPLDPEMDRVMICGSMAMLKDVKQLVEGLGFIEGSLSHPATSWSSALSSADDSPSRHDGRCSMQPWSETFLESWRCGPLHGRVGPEVLDRTTVAGW